MDLTLTEEQAQMQRAAREFFEAADVTDFARRQLDGEDVVDELWAELASMEYTTITVPTAHGGLGEGPLYLSLFLEEAGRAAVPGPVPETLGFAVPLLSELGTGTRHAETLESVAAGDERLSCALYEAPGTLPEDVQLSAESLDDGYRLDGSKTLVPYAASVDGLVVGTRTQAGSGFDGITLFSIPGPADHPDIHAEMLAGLDRTRPVYDVSFDGLEVPDSARLGPLHDGGAALSRALDHYRVAICALVIGAADRSVELTVDHTSSRTQFGEPVGRFQAVKHRTVDMWMDLELGRSLVYRAAWALDTEDPEAPRNVSAAKAFCGSSLPELFGDDIQNHGGIGYTWEHDAHIYLKQAKAWENYLGSPQDHRERIADTY